VSATFIKNIKDYIIEQGTSGIWTYRKWASGIAECWGLYNASDWDISTAWGYIFESATPISTTLPVGLFSDVPVFNMNVQNSTAGILSLETVSNVNKDMTCYIYPTRATPGKVSLTIAMRAIGKWAGSITDSTLPINKLATPTIYLDTTESKEAILGYAVLDDSTSLPKLDTPSTYLEIEEEPM
jgi:hypothetical protein